MLIANNPIENQIYIEWNDFSPETIAPVFTIGGFSLTISADSQYCNNFHDTRLILIFNTLPLWSLF